MAEFTVVGEDAVHVLPAGTTPLLGALVEPLAVARRAARQTGVEGFGTVAVHGAGAIGLGALLTFRAVGVTVIVSDPSPIRRRTAEELGAAATVDPTEQDVARELRAATDGLGVDASLDAAGVAPALAAAARSTRPGGTVVLVAHHHAPLPLKSISFIGNELTVRGSAIYDDADFAWVLERIASDLAPMRQIPTEMSMSKFLVDGLQELRNGSINKAVLRINGDFDGEV
jgi:threonine dehydrogenase-like Zn-dependent dehydrogenase